MKSDHKSQYIALAEAGFDGPQIAENMGVSKQRVYNLSKQTGVGHKSGKGRYRVRKGEIRNPARHEHGITLQPSWSGAVTEMIVATDLMKRGYFVYMPIARTGPFDLLAYSRESVLRIEVKSILWRGHHASMKNDNFDILARVMADGEIIYSEDPGVVEQIKRATPFENS